MSSSGYVPSGRGPELIGVYTMFVALTTIVVSLRVYARACLVKSFGPDDYTSVLSWALFICFASCAITGAFHGTGQHAWLILPAYELPIALKWWFLCEPLYVLSTMAVKLSIGIQLLRICTQKLHRMIVLVTIFVTQTYSIAFFFIFLFQCYPPKFFWTQLQGDTNGSCLNPAVVVNTFYAYSAICCVGDWIFAILPYFLVKDLQMNKRTKYLVAMILAMAALASTATIIRLPYLSSMSNKADFLFATMDVAIWSCAETGIGIIASSAATLKPLFKKFLENRKYADGSVPLQSRTQVWATKGLSKKGYERSSSPGSSVYEINSKPADLMTITKATTVDITHMRHHDDRD